MRERALITLAISSENVNEIEEITMNKLTPHKLKISKVKEIEGRGREAFVLANRSLRDRSNASLRDHSHLGIHAHLRITFTDHLGMTFIDDGGGEGWRMISTPAQLQTSLLLYRITK